MQPSPCSRHRGVAKYLDHFVLLSKDDLITTCKQSIFYGLYCINPNSNNALWFKYQQSARQHYPADIIFLSPFLYSPTDPCSTNPCQNGGICDSSEDPHGWGFYCKCPTEPRPVGGKLCDIGKYTVSITDGNAAYVIMNPALWVANCVILVSTQSLSQMVIQHMSK